MDNNLFVPPPSYHSLTRIGRTQVADTLRVRMNDEHVFVTMRLLLATVVQGLFSGLFRSLAPTLSAVNDVLRRLSLAAFARQSVAPFVLASLPGPGNASRKTGNTLQPLVRACLAQLKQLAQHDLERIGFRVNQNEQQLLLCSLQFQYAHPPPAFALTGPPSLVAFISTRWHQQTPATSFETPSGQPGQREQLTPVACQPSVFKFLL